MNTNFKQQALDDTLNAIANSDLDIDDVKADLVTNYGDKLSAADIEAVWEQAMDEVDSLS